MAFIAITAIGAVAVPLNGWWKGAELEYGLADSGKWMIIVFMRIYLVNSIS